MGLCDELPGLRADNRSVPAASLAAVTTGLLRPGGGSAADHQPICALRPPNSHLLYSAAMPTRSR